MKEKGSKRAKTPPFLQLKIGVFCKNKAYIKSPFRRLVFTKDLDVASA